MTLRIPILTEFQFTKRMQLSFPHQGVSDDPTRFTGNAATRFPPQEASGAWNGLSWLKYMLT